MFRDVRRKFNVIRNFIIKWKKDKETECSEHAVGTNGGWLVSEKTRTIRLCKILFRFRCFCSISISIFITNEDHQLLATPLSKAPDQLKDWKFSGKCFKCSKTLIRFLVLLCRFKNFYVQLFQAIPFKDWFCIKNLTQFF